MIHSCIIRTNLQNVSTTSWMSLKYFCHLSSYFSMAMFCLFSVFPNKCKDSKLVVILWRPESLSPLTGMATEVWIPSPHRTGNVCPALGPHHALSHFCHAARLWSQCHRDTGWENQGVSMHTKAVAQLVPTQSWGAHVLSLRSFDVTLMQRLCSFTLNAEGTAVIIWMN